MDHCQLHSFYHSSCFDCREQTRRYKAQEDNDLTTDIAVAAVTEAVVESIIDTPSADTSVSDASGFSNDSFSGGDFGGGGAGGDF